MSSEHQQPKEYIITDKMIKAWRNGCVKGIQIKFDDSRCLDCEFCGTGARYHCCDFDDVDVEKIFRSRPHPAPTQGLNFRPECPHHMYYEEYMGEPERHLCNKRKEWETAAARKAREDMAMEIIEWRHKSSKEFTIQEMWELEQEHLASFMSTQHQAGDP